MARLSDEERKEKYGIPISSRHEPEFVMQLTQDALKLGLSMSRYSGMLLRLGYNANKAILEERERCADAMAMFIEQIGDGSRKQKELIEIYNKIKTKVDEKNV